MDETDVNRNAKLLIEQHGSDAIKHAKERSDAMVILGDIDGARAWNRIARVIAEMQ